MKERDETLFRGDAKLGIPWKGDTVRDTPRREDLISNLTEEEDVAPASLISGDEGSEEESGSVPSVRRDEDHEGHKTPGIDI